MNKLPKIKKDTGFELDEQEDYYIDNYLSKNDKITNMDEFD